MNELEIQALAVQAMSRENIDAVTVAHVQYVLLELGKIFLRMHTEESVMLGLYLHTIAAWLVEERR